MLFIPSSLQQWKESGGRAQKKPFLQESTPINFLINFHFLPYAFCFSVFCPFSFPL